MNDRVREELAILVDRGIKAELDITFCAALAQFVAYVQEKLFDSDLIKL